MLIGALQSAAVSKLGLAIRCCVQIGASGRKVNVDHVKDYTPPETDSEDEPTEVSAVPPVSPLLRRPFRRWVRCAKTPCCA